ncbi:MAG TPA: hypothetical protein VG165_09945 [Solirubrobacteraceae bacterium]|jgi:hypothetical protein|nr:hypothetical protein [Solirubrobacteraceae bacterium]
MRIRHDILAAGSAAAVLLAAGGVPAAVGATTAPIHKLTKKTAAAAALKDAKAAATISGGDKVVISNCRAYGKSAFKCAVQLIPESSASRCHWTDTITLVKGRPNVRYSSVACSG